MTRVTAVMRRRGRSVCRVIRPERLVSTYRYVGGPCSVAPGPRTLIAAPMSQYTGPSFARHREGGLWEEVSVITRFE
jgi:hypothetical protein